MSIMSLGYLGVQSNKTDDWSQFAQKILGFQQIDKGANTLSFRMDDYKQRFVVSDEIGDSPIVIGWEVGTKTDLSEFADKIDNAGHKVQWGNEGLAAQRCVESLIVFNDPDGNRIELFSHPQKTTEPFIPGRPISGFKTGALGMGHAVLHVRDTKNLVPFYQDVLGFSLSDFGQKPVPLYFFHVNERHHSFAIVGSGRTGFHHFMVEYHNLDDVGQGYDLSQMQDDAIAYTLGRHTNDYMTSYYSNTPSNFFVESGWGGRLIDPDTWQPHETSCGPSFWGHDRLYLSDEARKDYRDMRMDIAAKGLRTPPIIDCPWLFNDFWRSKT